jgi:hypothetical protein
MAVTSYPSFFSIKGFGLYPNPSINKVQIYYSLTKRSELKINILNILGQEKIDVFTGTEEPGEYSKSIDSENLPSGTYFVKLVANGVASIKSLQIMH